MKSIKTALAKGITQEMLATFVALKDRRFDNFPIRFLHRIIVSRPIKTLQRTLSHELQP